MPRKKGRKKKGKLQTVQVRKANTRTTRKNTRKQAKRKAPLVKRSITSQRPENASMIPTVIRLLATRKEEVVQTRPQERGEKQNTQVKILQTRIEYVVKCNLQNSLFFQETYCTLYT